MTTPGLFPQPPSQPADPDTQQHCVECAERPAVACQECRRALALFDDIWEPRVMTTDGRTVAFTEADPSWLPFLHVISRHPESGTDCRLCRRGSAALCVECLLSKALDHRRVVRG